MCCVLFKKTKERKNMQLRYILRINQAMRKDEDRAYPYDLTEEALEGVTHFSENAGKDIPILDMDILHVVRALMKKEQSTLSSKSKSALEKVKGLLNELDLSLKT
jgi:hypothetical protein